MMEKEYTYSFIIPHKNCPKLLKRCVDSIPVREDIQIIVVDDNSDEGKKPSLNERKNLQVVLLDAENSNGAGRARNVGLEQAKGKWLLFPDSDDYYVEGFLDQLDSYKRNNTDVVYFNSIYKDGTTGELLPSLPLNADFEKYDGSRYMTDAIKYHHNSPWTKMISREYIQQNGIHFEESINGNDIFFSMRVGYNTNRIAVIKSPLYIYLRNRNGITRKKFSKREAFCLINHSLQLNQFYEYIAHKEWKKPIIKTASYYVKICGFSFFFYLCSKILHLLNRRKDLISFVSLDNR